MNENLQNAIARLIKVITYTFIGTIIITILYFIFASTHQSKEDQIRERIINDLYEKLDSIEKYE